MIRFLIISPIQAVRAGLRAMLLGYPANSSPRALEELHIEELPSLEHAEDYLDETDVLILAAELPSLAELNQVVSRQEGRLSLLLLTDELGQIAPAGRNLSALLISLSRLPLHSWGVLPSSCTTEELQAGVWALTEGLVIGAPSLLRPAIQQLNAGRVNGVPTSQEQIDPLTEREAQVLQLLAQGLANKQIAVGLSISEHTVKFHVSSIYAKLGVASRTEAVRTGLQHGLIAL